MKMDNAGKPRPKTGEVPAPAMKQKPRYLCYSGESKASGKYPKNGVMDNAGKKRP